MQIDFSGSLQGAEQVGFFAVFKRSYRFGQHLVVELKTHLQHIAALVFTEYLACTADFQVVHRQVKTGTQLFHLLNRIQPLGGVFAKTL